MTLHSALAQSNDFVTSWIGYDTSVYSSARYACGSALADLDSDGDLDLAVANWWAPSQVAVILNDGQGRFGQPAYYPTVSFQGCMDVVAADITGDDRLDLVAANTGANGEGNTVSLLRNLGGGTFAAQVTYSVGTGSFVGPVGLAAADFDADGRVDIAVANYGYLGQGGVVALLRNNGAGGFLAPVSHGVNAGPYKLAAGDLNGDGRPDLAVACDQKKLSLLLNNGSGFAPFVAYDILPSVGTDVYQSVALGDVDLDGDLDVLCGSSGIIDPVSGSAAIGLLRNLGNGALSPTEAVVTPLSGSDIALADLDGDGWLDILTAQASNGGWMTGRNDGTGHFPQASFRSYPSGEMPYAIEAGDVDGDGDVDPVVVNRYSLEAGVHRNPGSGDFSMPASYPAAPGGGGMDAGDVDGDGDLDMAVSYWEISRTDGGIRILRNRGAGAFDPPVDYPCPREPGDVKLRDLDRDGDLDLLWCDAFPPFHWETRTNLGGGAFGPLVLQYSNNCGNGGEIETGDMDGDGDLDVFLAEALACAGNSESGRRMWVYRNHGDGTFELSSILLLTLSPAAHECVDVNHDGRMDLVTSSACVMLGNGDGTFGPSTLYSSDDGPVDLVVADFDQDGNLDIATCNLGHGGPLEQQSMAILLGNGTGSFRAPVLYGGSLSPELSGVSGITTGDADEDSDLDLMVSNWGSNDVSLFRNRGNGTFAPQLRYGAGWHPTNVFFGDFTTDGHGDLGMLVRTPPSFLACEVMVLPSPLAPVAVQVMPFTGTRPVFATVRPNPFRATAEIRFALPSASRVRLKVYDVAGGRVAHLIDAVRPAGWQAVEWNARNDAGERVSPGIYIARLESAGRSASKKLVLLQ